MGERDRGPDATGGPGGAVGVRQAGPADAHEIAVLDAFNREFTTPTPGPEVLATRLQGLLADDRTCCWLAGAPAVGVALVTLRPNVWFDGPVALLDELYVRPARRDRGTGGALLAAMEAELAARGVERIEIQVDEGDTAARRFYERHGYRPIDADADELALLYAREQPVTGAHQVR